MTPRRGKQSLFCALALAVASQAAFWWAKETRVPELRDPEFAHKLRRLQTRIAENPDRELVLLLGSSRVGFGLRTDLLSVNRRRASEPMVFNCGMCGCTPVLQLLILRRLLDAGVRPAGIIVEWCPTHIWYGREQADKFAKPARLSRTDLELLLRFSAHPDDLEGSWRELQALPIYANRHIVLNRFAPSWVPRSERFDNDWRSMNAWGWTPRSHFAKRKEGEGLTTYLGQRDVLYRQVFSNWSPSWQSDLALREMLALCDEHGIRVAFYWAPEMGWLRQRYTPDALRQIAQYHERLGSPAFINAREWVPDDEFHEETHVTHAGAATCAKQFDLEVVPLLRDGSLWKMSGRIDSGDSPLGAEEMSESALSRLFPPASGGGLGWGAGAARNVNPRGVPERD